MGGSKVMGIFKRKRKKKYNTEFIQVPMPVLVRQVVYDSIFGSSEKIAVMMGLPPVSDEVSEMEQRASEDRIDKFAALLPFIDAHADISAQVSATAYRLESEEEGRIIEDNEGLEELTRLFKLVSMSAAVSCISTLMDLDLLETRVVSEDDKY
jgi:hypothetical protein